MSSAVRFLRVREASEADNAGLLGLTESSVMGRGVRWTIERGPDFFTPLRAESGGWWVVLAEDTAANECVGCISVAAREAYVAGLPRPTAYLSRFQVRPDYRRRGIGDELCRRMAELCRRVFGDDGLALEVIREGNRHMRRRLAGPRGLPGLRRFAQVRVHSIPTRRLRSARPRRDLVEVEQATLADIDEMATLGGRVFPERQFGPVFDRDSLARWIVGAPGLDISDHLLAWEKDALVGWLGIWDESVMRRARVAGYSRAGALGNSIHDAFSPITGARLVPKVGEVVGCAAVVHICVPQHRPDVLRSLLAGAGRRLSGRGCPWLRVALDPRDRLTGALHRLRARGSSFGAYATSLEGACAGRPLHHRPLHFEAALA